MESNKKTVAKKVPIRIDFKIEEVEIINKEKGQFRFRMAPDPQVWERTVKGRESGYENKFDKMFIPEAEIAKMASQMIGMPITYRAPPYSRVRDYVEKSKQRIEAGDNSAEQE